MQQVNAELSLRPYCSLTVHERVTVHCAQEVDCMTLTPSTQSTPIRVIGQSFTRVNENKSISRIHYSIQSLPLPLPPAIRS